MARARNWKGFLPRLCPSSSVLLSKAQILGVHRRVEAEMKKESEKEKHWEEKWCVGCCTQECFAF